MSNDSNYVLMKKGEKPTDIEKEAFERLLILLPVITNSKENLVNFDLTMINLYSNKCTECLVKSKINLMVEKLKEEDFK